MVDIKNEIQEDILLDKALDAFVDFIVAKYKEKKI